MAILWLLFNFITVLVQISSGYSRGNNLISALGRPFVTKKVNYDVIPGESVPHKIAPYLIAPRQKISVFLHNACAVVWIIIKTVRAQQRSCYNFWAENRCCGAWWCIRKCSPPYCTWKQPTASYNVYTHMRADNENNQILTRSKKPIVCARNYFISPNRERVMAVGCAGAGMLAIAHELCA